MYMSTHLKRVQKSGRQDVAGLFLLSILSSKRDGLLVPGRPTTGGSGCIGAAILAGVSSTVIQFTKVFSFCGVRSGVHCNTPTAVCSNDIQGQGPIARRVSGLMHVNVVRNTRFFERRMDRTRARLGAIINVGPES
jgi:hypothetical protein